MQQLFDLFEGIRLEPIALVDILFSAILIYGIFSLIQGTRAVRLVIGAIILYLIFVMAQELNLVLLSGIMQAGAVVGLFALVVVFQPELRRGLDRLGRVGSLGWLGRSDASSYQHTVKVLANSAVMLSRRRVGALIVVERVSGLADMAETGVPINAHLSTELLTSLFAPGYPLHDGAVIVSADQIVAAGVMLPLAQRLPSTERYGTRHRAALGVTEQTDALGIVVSEETGAISLAESGRILRELDEAELRQRLYGLLGPADVARRARRMAPRGHDDAAEAPALTAVDRDESAPDESADAVATGAEKTGTAHGAASAPK